MNDMIDKVQKWLTDMNRYVQNCFDQPLEVNCKSSESDLVTNIDRFVEKSFRRFIFENYPTHRILGEEYTSENVQTINGDVWVIDPIDGTLNLALAKQDFSTMVAYFKDGIAQLSFISDVMNGDVYIAIKDGGVYNKNSKLEKPEPLELSQFILSTSGAIIFDDYANYRQVAQCALAVRMIGSASQSFIRMINGKLGGYLATSLSPWDFLPGILFMEELGYVYGNPFNERFNPVVKQPFLFTFPNAYKEIKSILLDTKEEQ